MESRRGRHTGFLPPPIARGVVRCCAVIALAALVIVPSAPRPRAGAFEQLQQMGGSAGSVPEVSKPECVGGCGGSSGGSSSGSDNSGGSSSGGIFNLFDRLQEQADERAAEQRQEAHQQNERGVAEYKRGNYKEALRLFRQAADNNPDDKVIQQNVKNAEAQVARQEQAQREQAAFRRLMAQYAALMPAAKPVTGANGVARPAESVVPPPGIAPDLWQAYLDAANEANRLEAKLNRDGRLSDADGQAFVAALQRRNALWAQITSHPLDAVDRESLEMQTRVPDSKSRPDVSERIRKIVASDEAAPAGSPPSSRAVSVLKMVGNDIANATGSGTIAEWATAAVRAAHGETMTERFDELVGVAHVTMRSRKEGPAGDTSEGINYAIGKLPDPMQNRAAIARHGGQVYAKVVHRALDDFMEKTTKITGGTFDSAEFQKEFDADLTQEQKVDEKWIGYGN